VHRSGGWLAPSSSRCSSAGCFEALNEYLRFDMRSSLRLLALATLAALPRPLLAEEPHLEFVHTLRARGMADLALEYLQSKSQNPPAGLAIVLPLELAKTRLDLAASRPDPAGRAALQKQALTELGLFVKNNPSHPLAAEASLDIARVAALQGRAQLSKARRSETKERQQAELIQARRQFEEAARQLSTAAAAIDGQLANAGGPEEADKQSLAQAKLRAELEQGVNLLEQAQTYTDAGEVAKRAELLKRAVDTLDKLARREPRNPICLQALAWLGRCYQENDDPKAARKAYMDVIAEPGEPAEAAKRLARFFRMQTLGGEGTDPKKTLLEVRKAGEEWLQLYPNHLETPEGCGVRFELALTYLKQAAGAPKGSAQAHGLHEQAQSLFRALEQTENDYTAEAHEHRYRIILQMSQQSSGGDISKLRDFAACYMRSQLELAQISDEAKKLKGDELEAARKRHFQNILSAAERAIDLAQDKTPVEELNDVRYLLAYAYLMTEDYYRAAVAGEALALGEPKAPRAPAAAACALRAYVMLIARQEEAGAGREEHGPERDRLRSLAGYVEQTWPTDASADYARHMLGWLLLTEKNYADAVTVLERVGLGYAEYTRALCQLAEAALLAHKDGTSKPAPGAPSYQDRALAALLKVPELARSADAGTAQAYFGARQMLAGIYYRSKQYDKMESLTDGLLKQVDDLDEKTKTEHRSTVLGLTLYAKLGRAEAEYAAGHFGRARELLEPVVKLARELTEADVFARIREKDPQVLRAALVLALRASVQDNKESQGLEILELLKKSFPANSSEIMVQFVQQLNQQMQQLQRQGESARSQLEKTVASFSRFLDVLARQQENAAKSDMTLFLAQSYSGLGNHVRAAELANQIGAPKPSADGKAPEARELQLYRLARLLVLREHRLSREFDKADVVLKEVAETPWGKNSLDVQKERISLLEDQGKYVLPNKQGAIAEWDKLMRSMRTRLSDNRVKEQYFDCYYHLTYCIYKHALQIADPKKRQQGLRVAANYITKLEAHQDPATEACKKRFEELLDKEPALKAICDELKKHS
jgi:hypothetical protein